MKRVVHHVKRQSRSVASHLKNHHKKYVFGLISAALLYKAVSLILAAIFVNNVWMHYSYADDIQDPINPETEITEDLEWEDEIVDELEDDVVDELENENSVLENICDLGDISVLKPLSWDILKWNIDIVWEHENDDCADTQFIIKLRDANTQYVTIWNSDIGENSIVFDSFLLYSWFYNITWLNSSGNEVILHTWDYSGINTKYFTWHKIVLYSSDMDVLYEWSHFTIDNEIPNLSWVTLNVTWSTGGYVWLNKKIEVLFSSSEVLSWVSVNILWVDAVLDSKNGNNYKYILYLSNQNTAWNIIYNITFEDLAGNTWYYEWYSNIIFDKTAPAVTDLLFTKTWDHIKLQLNTNELSKLNFVYALSGNNTWYNYNTQYLTSHTYMFSGVNSWQYYNYSIAINDIADNIWYIWWYFKVSWDNVVYSYNNINSSSMLVGIWFNTGDLNTGNTNTWSFAETLLVEIEKFKLCKNWISNLTNMDIPVWSYFAAVKMPELEKSYVRKLVSAFSIVLFERVEQAWLSRESIDKITADFNDFLVILKLVQDDDNQCEQNLSNYYMSKFRNNLIKYNLTVN